MKNTLGTLIGTTALLTAGIGLAQTNTGPNDASFLQKLAPDLAQSELGREFLQTWASAEKIADGRLGPYPFDEQGKTTLLHALGRLPEQIDQLVKSGLLQPAEGDLLKLDGEHLTQAVQEMRPRELVDASCYEPVMFTPVKNSFKRLSDRLPFLEKVTGNKISPLTAVKVMAAIQKDLEILRKRNPEASFDAVAEEEARHLEERIVANLKSLEERGIRLGENALPPADEARAVIERVNRENLELSKTTSTMADRELAEQRHNEGIKAIHLLVELKALSRAEGDLNILELQNIREDILREPPVDSNVTCYRRAFVSPARVSWKRLEARLPLLEKLVAQKGVHAETAKKIIQSLEADLRRLTENPDEQMDPAAKADMEKTAKSVAAHLQSLRTKVSP